MKKILTMSILAAFMLVANSGLIAQKASDAKGGDYSFLKDVKKVNILFDYEGMTVGKNQTEIDYVAEKVAEKNEKKAGKGDEWKKSWEKGKLNIYEPAFAKSFTKKIGKKLGIEASVGNDAPITLIVRSTRMEPGYNVGVSKMSAIVDMEIIFVETANHENVKGTVYMNKIYGSDTYAVSDRLAVSYSRAGAKLAGYIAKFFK